MFYFLQDKVFVSYFSESYSLQGVPGKAEFWWSDIFDLTESKMEGKHLLHIIDY